jgi:uncharacterized SAM-binding protein YcdF (DUF218 family)
VTVISTNRSRRRSSMLSRHRIGLVLVSLVVLFCAATARLFVWPANGMPQRVDVIVMVNGSGNRLNTALDLAWEHRASAILISRGSKYWGHGDVCAPAIPNVKVICFDPDPETTRGEAEFAGRMAKRYHWQSMVLVATAPQDTRARLRFGRCFGGKIYVVNAAFPAHEWPYEIAYEWAATIKALVFERSC